MSIARMSTLHNLYRFVTVAIDDYNDGYLKGVIFHGNLEGGCQFENILQILIFVNQIYDEMSCPKKTVDFRSFDECSFPRIEKKVSKKEKTIRNGKSTTCRINIKYRYFASWQGSITWLENDETEWFNSVLQLIRLIDGHLRQRNMVKLWDREAINCHLAIDSCRDGNLTGWGQMFMENRPQEFEGILQMTEMLEKSVHRGSNLISEAYWNAYRSRGKIATFTIRVLYREHDSWQGTIYWREQRKKAVFRSFMEMLMLMASAFYGESMEAEGRLTLLAVSN